MCASAVNSSPISPFLPLLRRFDAGFLGTLVDMAASQRCCVLSCSGDGEFYVSGDQLKFAKSAGGGRGSAKREDLSYTKQEGPMRVCASEAE